MDIESVPTEEIPTEEMLAQVLEAIFGFADGSPIQRALKEAGVESITDLLTLGTEDISELRYSSRDGEPPITKLKALEMAKLKKISPFHAALCRKNGGLPALKTVVGCLQGEVIKTTSGPILELSSDLHPVRKP